MRSWLLFHDADLGAEYIGLHPQSPPPPGDELAQAEATPGAVTPTDVPDDPPPTWAIDRAPETPTDPLPSYDDPLV